MGCVHQCTKQDQEKE